MHLQLTQVLHRGLVEDVGLTYQDFVILAELSGGPRRFLDLAQSLGLEKSRLSHHLKRMAGRGIIEKQPAAEDRRGAVLSLTPAGRQQHADALAGHHERVRRYFADQLTVNEAKAIASVTRKVGEALAQSDGS